MEKIKKGLKNSLKNKYKIGNYRHGLYSLFAFKKMNANGICEICHNGIKGQIKFLDIHHKDENRENNNLTNLICICPNCHRKIHMKLINIS